MRPYHTINNSMMLNKSGVLPMLPDRVMVSLVVPAGDTMTAVAEEEDMVVEVDMVVEEVRTYFVLRLFVFCAYHVSLFYFKV